jgi:hypothetical protein
MRKLAIPFYILLWAVAMLLAASVPAHAIDIFISDQGGSHVGSCEDNNIQGSSAFNIFNFNYGAAPTNTVGETTFTAPSRTRIIQRYDIAPIPDSATIQSAEIVMEATIINGSGDTVRLRQIATANNDWVEGTANGATQAGSSCWNDYAYQNITEWAGSPGLQTGTTDFITTVISNDPAISTTGTKTFTFNGAGVAALQGQLVDNDFEVLFLNTTTTSNNYITFASSENATANLRPYLKVTYIVEAEGAAIIIIRR